LKRAKLDQENDNLCVDPMQVDQNSSCFEMKADVLSQESVAGTSNVPAVSEKPVDDQLPDVMIEMKIRDERNANREDKVSCLINVYIVVVISISHCSHLHLACEGYGNNCCKRQWDRNGTSYYDDSWG